jgi:hypothetical protein
MCSWKSCFEQIRIPCALHLSSSLKLGSRVPVLFLLTLHIIATTSYNQPVHDAAVAQ